jgi:hypothetical protein
MQRPGDVLDILLAKVVERDVELSGDVFVIRARHADAAWLGRHHKWRNLDI